jgi:hypothetical protein
MVFSERARQTWRAGRRVKARAKSRGSRQGGREIHSRGSGRQILRTRQRGRVGAKQHAVKIHSLFLVDANCRRSLNKLILLRLLLAIGSTGLALTIDGKVSLIEIYCPIKQILDF